MIFFKSGDSNLLTNMYFCFSMMKTQSNKRMTNHRTAKATLKWVRKSASNQEKSRDNQKVLCSQKPNK